MLELLPKSLEVDGKRYEINTDYRVALLIFRAYSDPELNDYEKCRVCLECLYKTVPKNIDEALGRAMWFLDGGDMPKSKPLPAPVLDWERDAHLIFPALNKAAGREIRAVDYLHWWSFLGLFNEVGDGLYSQVMNIRVKLVKHKKLDKTEREYFKEHKELISPKPKLSAAEQKELDEEMAFINSLV